MNIDDLISAVHCGKTSCDPPSCLENVLDGSEPRPLQQSCLTMGGRKKAIQNRQNRFVMICEKAEKQGCNRKPWKINEMNVFCMFLLMFSDISGTEF